LESKKKKEGRKKKSNETEEARGKKKKTNGWMDGWTEKRRVGKNMAVCALLRIVSYRPGSLFGVGL
jgi:hypothetical protein